MTVPGKGGRPKKSIDPEQVRQLALIHCTLEEIGSVVGCSVDTLERRFADVIKEGKNQGKASLRRMQYQAAQKGSYALLIWLGKQILNQTDRQDFTTGDQKIDPKIQIISYANALKQNGFLTNDTRPSVPAR